MLNVAMMTPEDVRAYVQKDQERRAKQLQANKAYRQTHPPSAEQIAARKAYNRTRAAERSAERKAILLKAAELGLLS